MGGAVSSGRDNGELIDNLVGSNYIRTRDVEKVFRALDRAEYMTPDSREQAYKDLAWRNGPLHMSAPCIYSEVMEGLELKPGLSFLNIGSGTGYLSTLVGLIIGSSGINHGVEVHGGVTDYSLKKLSQFMENSPILDEFDFCEPRFYTGNGLCLAPLQCPYDRVYCGAGCPEEYQNYFQQLIKIGGILVMPLNDNLLQVKRIGPSEWTSRSLLNVSFATLKVPHKDEAQDLIRLEEQTPSRLQVLARAVIRESMRGAMRRRHPQLREPPPRAPPAKKTCPRRICIPVDDDSDNDGLNALHDLDHTNGGNEMNALLSLVLSMGHNRVAGALRVDPLDSPTDTDTDEDDEDDDDDDGDDDEDGGGGPSSGDVPLTESNNDSKSGPEAETSESPTTSPSERPGSRGRTARRRPRDDADTEHTHSGRSLIMFEIRDNRTHAHEPTPAPIQSESTDDNRDTNSKESESKERRSSTSDKDSSPNSSTSKDASQSTRDSGVTDKDTLKPRRRGRGSRRTFKEPEADSPADEGPNPDVPTEVEIYLGKTRDAPGTSMEWEAADDRGSGDDADAGAKEEKRQKLDSGIGDEHTPASSAHTSKSDDSDHSRRSDSGTDDGCGDDGRGRRRRQKRGHLSTRSSTSTEGEESSVSDAEDVSAAHRARRRRRLRSSSGARRVQLSVVMKRGVKELPLPHALKKYVNLNRCFEF